LWADFIVFPNIDIFDQEILSTRIKESNPRRHPTIRQQQINVKGQIKQNLSELID
jgi:hypothetical protein